MRENQRNRLAVERPQSHTLDLNLRSLDIFVQIAESGGMSSTARRTGLTQSAVSQMIASLEGSLGIQLFDRQVRPIALTPSGVILLEKARGLLHSARDAINAARQPLSAAFPKLNLCLVEAVAGTIGPDLLFQIQGCAALWSVRAGLHSDHSRQLLSREADIIISPDPLEDEPNLERHEILKERFVLALPKDFTGKVESLPALAECHDLVRYSARTVVGCQIERHLRRLRIEAKGRVEFDNSDAVLAMVAGGHGWALITPTCTLLGRTFWPKLRLMPMPAPSLSRSLYVVARRGELGDIPSFIADTAVSSMHKTFDADFSPEYRWMAEGCVIPPRAQSASAKAPVREVQPPLPIIADVPPSISSVRRSPLRGLSPSGRLARNS